MEQGAQRSCGCPVPGTVQGQVGQVSALVEGTSALGRDIGLDDP